MTWKELQEHIEVMDEEQTNSDVTVYFAEQDEYHPLLAGSKELTFAPHTDVLDKNHPFLII